MRFCSFTFGYGSKLSRTIHQNDIWPFLIYGGIDTIGTVPIFWPTSHTHMAHIRLRHRRRPYIMVKKTRWFMTLCRDFVSLARSQYETCFFSGRRKKKKTVHSGTKSVGMSWDVFFRQLETGSIQTVWQSIIPKPEIYKFTRRRVLNHGTPWSLVHDTYCLFLIVRRCRNLAMQGLSQGDGPLLQVRSEDFWRFLMIFNDF